MGTRTDTIDTVEAGTFWAALVAEQGTGLVLLDERGTVLAANDQATALTGLTPAQLRRGAPPAGWLARAADGAALPAAADLAGQVLRTGAELVLPVLVLTPAGPRRRLRIGWHPVRHHGVPGVLLVLTPDADGAVPLTDPLTGLPGRTLLTDRLGQALTRARTLGTLTTLIRLDVAGLAGVNEQLGFDRGDELLTALAGRLRAGLRADHTAARLGGTVFAVVAEHPGGTGEQLADQCRDLVHGPLRLAGHRYCPSVRVRWLTSDGTTSPQALLARLDR
jgi:GGDEF domain-containing protein